MCNLSRRMQLPQGKVYLVDKLLCITCGLLYQISYHKPLAYIDKEIYITLTTAILAKEEPYNITYYYNCSL